MFLLNHLCQVQLKFFFLLKFKPKNTGTVNKLIKPQGKHGRQARIIQFKFLVWDKPNRRVPAVSPASAGWAPWTAETTSKRRSREMKREGFLELAMAVLQGRPTDQDHELQRTLCTAHLYPSWEGGRISSSGSFPRGPSKAGHTHPIVYPLVCLITFCNSQH